MKAKSSCTLPNKIPNKMVNSWRGLTDCNRIQFSLLRKTRERLNFRGKNLLCQFCSISEEQKRIDEVALKRALCMLRHRQIVLFLPPPCIAFLKKLLPSKAPRGAHSYNRKMFPLWLRGTCPYCQEQALNFLCVGLHTCNTIKPQLMTVT